MYIPNKESPFYYEPNSTKEDSNPFMNYLYHDRNRENPEKTIKSCFYRFYEEGAFLDAVYSNLVEYDGFTEDGCYWYQSDIDAPDHERFEGVRFEMGFDDPDWSVQVSEEVAFHYTKEACLRFLEIHPEHTDFVMNILNNWKPSTANNQ